MMAQENQWNKPFSR